MTCRPRRRHGNSSGGAWARCTWFQRPANPHGSDPTYPHSSAPRPDHIRDYDLPHAPHRRRAELITAPAEVEVVLASVATDSVAPRLARDGLRAKQYRSLAGRRRCRARAPEACTPTMPLCAVMIALSSSKWVESRAPLLYSLSGEKVQEPARDGDLAFAWREVDMEPHGPVLRVRD